LERLERTVASGASGATATTAPGPPAAGAAPVAHAAAVAPPPTGSGSGPAASAREELARATGAPPRPARAPVKKATAPPTAAPSRPPADTAERAPAPEPAPAAPPATPASGGEVPPAEELAQAWHDSVHPGLNRGTKAMFVTGRFVESQPDAAVFALANGPTRDHCEKKRPEVEAALSAHFGRPIRLHLVIEDEAAAAPSRPPASAAPASPPADHDDEIVDVHALEDAPTAATGVERLSEAFPGAELVEEP
jgi:hypothetical protein